jgi:PPOX class probable F420-dependent enzyme
MGISLSEDIKALVRGANFAHLATLMPDGSPQAAPVWVDLEGDRILVCTGQQSVKARNAARDARVALSIVGQDNPYQEAQIRGRVVERRPDPELKTIDRLSAKYTRKPFPMRESPDQRVVLVIEAMRARYLALPFAHTPST